MNMETAERPAEVADELVAASEKTNVVALNPLLQVKAGLADLAAQSQTFDVTTPAGEKMARAFRAKCVSLRTSLDDAYEKVNRPLLTTQRAARALLAEIKAEIVKLEEPADAQIKAVEAAKERIRQERLEKEAARIAAIRQRIVDLFSAPAGTLTMTSEQLRDLYARIEANPVDESFEDLKIEAQTAKVSALEWLTGIIVTTKAREAEAAALALQRLDLEMQRQRDAAERAAQKAEHDAAERKLKADREAFDKEQAEARRAAQEQREAQEAEERHRREEREAAEARARAAVIEAQARLERSAPTMLATLRVVRTALPEGILIPGTPRLLSDLVDETIAEALSTPESQA